MCCSHSVLLIEIDLNTVNSGCCSGHLVSILEQHEDQLGGRTLKCLEEDIPEAKFHFLIMEVELYCIRRLCYDSKHTPETPRQAWNKSVQHKRCQRKAGVINIESSDICSSLCPMKTRLISSPEKPQKLDSSMLN